MSYRVNRETEKENSVTVPKTILPFVASAGSNDVWWQMLVNMKTYPEVMDLVDTASKWGFQFVIQGLQTCFHPS